jgi:hypothetical protein
MHSKCRRLSLLFMWENGWDYACLRCILNAQTYSSKAVRGMNLSRGKIFCACPDQPEAHPASCTMVTKSFLVVQWLGHGTAHPLPSSTKVANGLQLCLRPPLCPSLEDKSSQLPKHNVSVKYG